MNIFFSYGRDQHQDFIKKIKKDLVEKYKLNVWIDSVELKTADPIGWERSIEAGIEQSDKVLYFLTPHSTRRPDGYCEKELRYTNIFKKPIIPIMVEKSIPPISLCTIQYTDIQNIANNFNSVNQTFTNKNIEDLYYEKLEEIYNVLKNELSFKSTDQEKQLIYYLKPLDFNQDISKHLKNFVGRKWLYKKVDELLQDDDSRVLWIIAEAGFGKTSFSTYLQHQHPSAIGIHYCKYDNPKRKDSINILATLIYQISTQVTEYNNLLESENFKNKLLKMNEMDKNTLLDELLIQPLNKINRSENCFFIIDALDEAYENGTNELAKLITKLEDLPHWLKIVVTSRPEPYLKRELSKLKTIELDAQSEQNLDDLRLYIKEYENHKNCEILKESDIQAVLIEKSEGNILYLKEVIESIMAGDIKDDEINALPSGMTGLYVNMFERYFPDVDDYEELIMPVFELLCAANTPLSKELVSDILNIKKRDFKKILGSIGSLIEENDEGEIYFYHKSLSDWLVDENLCSDDYFVDIEEGHNNFGKYYISKNDHLFDYINELGFFHSLVNGNNIAEVASYYEQNKKKIIYPVVKNVSYIFKNKLKGLIENFIQFTSILNEKSLIILLLQVATNLIETGIDNLNNELANYLSNIELKKQFNLLIELKYAEQKSDYNKVESLANKLLEYSEDSEQLKGIALYYIADTMRVKGTNPSYDYFKQSKDLLDSDMFFLYWMQASSWMADQAFIKGDAEESKILLNELLNVSKKKNSKELEGTVYRLLGQIEHTMERYELAESLFIKSIECLENANQRVKLSLALNNLAQTYAYYKPELSKKYFDRSRRLSKFINYPREEGKTYYVEAEYLIEQKFFIDALKALNTSELILNKIDYISGVMYVKYLKAKIYLEQGEYQKAYELTFNVLKHYYQKLSHPWLCIKVYDISYKSAVKINKVKELIDNIKIDEFKYFEQYSNFNDLIKLYIGKNKTSN